MIRDYEKELKNRVAWIRGLLDSSGHNSIVYGASGGKDSVLVGILCKLACPNTIGVIMPCQSQRNFNEDKQDALIISKQFDIEHIEVDLTNVKASFVDAHKSFVSVHKSSADANKSFKLDLAKSPQAINNIAPRLRMICLYSIAAANNALVAGTGNKSEIHMGYFTKWGDGASDFNPIADLSVTEIFEFLKHLGVAEHFWQKAPSAGLFEGQTDEDEMGVSYAEIDAYLLNGEKGENYHIIEKAHKASAHKRAAIKRYGDI